MRDEDGYTPVPPTGPRIVTRRRGVPVRIFGHPPHTGLVHFPLGLLGAVPLWDAAAAWRGPDPWAALAFWTLALGLASAVPAAATGLLDYAALGEDTPAARRADQHLWAVLLALALYGVSLGLRWQGGGPAAAPGGIAVLMGVGGLVPLAVGGWLGGDLVLRHGVGRAEAAPGDGEPDGAGGDAPDAADEGGED